MPEIPLIELARRTAAGGRCAMLIADFEQPLLCVGREALVQDLDDFWIVVRENGEKRLCVFGRAVALALLVFRWSERGG